MSIVGNIAGRLPWLFDVHTGDPFSSYILTGPYADDDATSAYAHPNHYRHVEPIPYPRAGRLPKAAR